MAGRALSDEERKDLRKRLIRGVRLVIQGDPGVTLSGQPVEDFIAGSEPSNPFSAFQWRAGRAICDRWARTGRSSILPGRDLYLRNLCTPYLGAGLPDDPTTAPPFTGGQCFGSIYTVNWQRVLPTLSNTQNKGIGNNPGPITAFITERIGTILRTSITRGTATPGVFQTIIANEEDVGSLPAFNQNVTVTATTGPNNCGDPPSLFDPGDPNPTADPNPGPIGAPPGYPFGDLDITINPDGTITIDLGDGSPDVVIDPGTGLDDGAGAGDIGEPGTPGDTGAGGDEEGEAPEGQVLTALKIAILGAPPQAKEFRDGFFRGAAYVFMGTSEGLDMDFAGSILTDGQLVLAEKDNLTNWKVLANAGYNLRVTPYYRPE